LNAAIEWSDKSRPSGVSTLIKDHLAGGASRLAALLLSHILPVLHPTVHNTHGGGPALAVVAPYEPGSPARQPRWGGRPGAALRDLVLVQRGHATSRHAL